MVEFLKSTNTERDALGRFVPGNREASKRRGKKYQSAYALARACTHVAVEALLDVVADPKAKQATRVAAAKTLLNYGWGKRPVDIVGLVEAASVVRESLNAKDLVNEITKENYRRWIALLLCLNPDFAGALSVMPGSYCSLDDLDGRIGARGENR